MKKITVLGDVMCEPPVFNQAKKADGSFDFMPAYKHLKPLLKDADYVMANLETPLAGEKLEYTYRLVSFNAPDEIAETMKEIGVDFVSTANNHAMDRGDEGLQNTIKALDRIGLDHTGTFVNYRNDMPERIFYKEVGDTKMAIIAYTYGTNYGINKNEPDEKKGNHVNYLRPCTTKLPVGERKYSQEYTDALKLCAEVAGKKPMWEDEVKMRNALHIPQAYADDVLVPKEYEDCLKQVEADYKEARKNADLVFIMPHMGGQFNEKPGAFSEYMSWEFMKMGFDAVLAAHSHTLQKAEYIKKMPCFFSIGNVSMSPFSTYAARETLPEFSVVPHIYVEKGKIKKITFSICKIVEELKGGLTVTGSMYRERCKTMDGDTPVGRITVYPIEKLHEKLNDEQKAELLKELEVIYKRVTGKKFPGIRAEYTL
ncbi:MAG: CapA family protein [Lachnospiraceae bacterium]|nr:CapA family protein [Lachnospiraceae bacterium]